MGFTVLIADYVTQFIAATGYFTVFFGMVLESMIFPVPSEAIMPFAGFLIAEGKFSFFFVIAVSTLGSMVGSLLSYGLGRFYGKPFIKKFGRYFLVDEVELDFTERFFQKRGAATIFISRFIPVIRHLISIPAGVAKMDLWKFSALTVLGAGMWNAALAVLGYYLRQNWQLVVQYGAVVDHVVLAIILILVGVLVVRRIRKIIRARGETSASRPS